MNIRHEIDPVGVAASIEKAVARYEQLRVQFKEQAEEALASYNRRTEKERLQWSKVPRGPAYVDPMIDDWIASERVHYARVRVIELPTGSKRFLLVYGDADDATVTSGTGPFASYEKACDWFLNQGR